MSNIPRTSQTSSYAFLPVNQRIPAQVGTLSFEAGAELARKSSSGHSVYFATNILAFRKRPCIFHTNPPRSMVTKSVALPIDGRLPGEQRLE